MVDATTLDSQGIVDLLDAIAVRTEKITKTIQGTGEASTKHFGKAGENVVNLDKGIQSLSRSLLGPIGLAAGFVAVAKSLDNFAVGQLQLSNLARNTGLAATQVLRIQTAARVAGESAEFATSTIQGFNSALNDIKMNKEGAEAFKQIQLGMGNLGQILVHTERIGDRMGSLAAIQRSYVNGTDEWRLKLEQVFHTNATGMAVMFDDLKGVVLLRDRDTDAMKEYNKQWVSLTNILTDMWGDISMAALIEINKISGGMENLQTTAENVSKAIAAFFKDNLGPTLGSTLSDISNIITGLNKIQELMGQGSKSSGEIMGGGTTKFREQFKQEPSGLGGLFKGWFGGDSGDLPKNARPRMYSSTDDIDKDSNKVLHDIRDMMQRSEIRAGGGGSGGGGGTPGGGGSGPIFRPGIGGMGGTRGNRNNNRGNIKFGEFAKSMGATGQDERGFAVFPDQATGDAAHAALLKSPAYQGLTLDQFGNKYSEGNADWKRTVGAALGIGPGDIVNTNDPRLMEGIRRAEGTASGGRMDPMAPTGMRPIGGQGVTSITSPSGRSFTVAKEFAANFQGFINDYEGAGGKIGPESGGVGSRGNPSYHPLGRAIDINQAGYGIRSRSGTTLPQDVEDKLAMKWGLFPGSQFKSRSDIGHFEVRNAELAAEARERLDKSMRTEPLNGSLNATVDFSNVPSGVKTNAKGSGFKLLRVTSSKQNQQSTEGLLGPGDGLYTQFVP